MLFKLINQVLDSTKFVPYLKEEIKGILPNFRVNTNTSMPISISEFLKATNQVYEKIDKKILGAYYTPNDVCRFIIKSIINIYKHFYIIYIFTHRCQND